MQLNVKLMGMLKSKTPPDGKLDVPDGTTVEEVLKMLDLPAERIQVVMVNGRVEPDRSRSLSADDELTVLAPVGGG